jgi:hypothetical protein
MAKSIEPLRYCFQISLNCREHVARKNDVSLSKVPIMMGDIRTPERLNVDLDCHLIAAPPSELSAAPRTNTGRQLVLVTWNRLETDAWLPHTLAGKGQIARATGSSSICAVLCSLHRHRLGTLVCGYAAKSSSRHKCTWVILCMRMVHYLKRCTLHTARFLDAVLCPVHHLRSG